MYCPISASSIPNWPDVVRASGSCNTSRFFEQAALETVATEMGEALYTFPATENYGWWRLWQGTESSQALFNKWSFKRLPMTAGIAIDGIPFGSVHTHFFEKKDAATKRFNEVVIEMLTTLKRIHTPAKKLLYILAPK